MAEKFEAVVDLALVTRESIGDCNIKCSKWCLGGRRRKSPGHCSTLVNTNSLSEINSVANANWFTEGISVGKYN